MKITKLFKSQQKLLKYIPIVGGLFFVQLVLGGYLANLYTEPSKDFIISQNILPFNVIRSMHTQLAILWVAVGWLFGGLVFWFLLIISLIKKAATNNPIVSTIIWSAFAIATLYIAGSALLNWIGAGFFGMVINTPTISYYSHGTYLIMPHGHIALLGAFGYISIAFIYMTSRTNALANGLVWDDKPSKIGFWALTVGALLFVIPTLLIGLEQTKLASEMGYYFTRTREAVETMKGWMWARTVPDVSMIIGGGIILFDLVQKTFFAKKVNQ